MADIFDIDSSGYSHQKNSGGWIPVETNSVSRKDPRLARRDDGRKRYSPGSSPRRNSRGRRTSDCSSSPPKSHDSSWISPQRMNKSSQMYSQPPPSQPYQAPPPNMYNEYNSSYGQASSSYAHGYQQSYQQPPCTTSFTQYNPQTSYPQQTQAYTSGQHHQPGPPGDEYPGAWVPVPPAYPNMGHPPPPPPVPRPPSVVSAPHAADSKTDDLKKEAIAQELKQQRATLIKQRDEYLRKASVLRRELEKLRLQKHELLSEKSPPRDSQRILRENAKLQLEIQNKLKSINNVVDMLSGIIGDGLKPAGADPPDGAPKPPPTSPKRLRRISLSDDDDGDGDNEDDDDDGIEGRRGQNGARDKDRDAIGKDTGGGDGGEWPRCNYIHYDPELHWCRVCDVFPRSAKDFLNHLHSAEHRQVTQEHQLVDTPWHKLPTDPELPTYKGAPVKRVPIKGLQFFISATAWYCKLCDVWIGDLHCASLHLKSKNHSHNYSNFVEQNPHWETNWLKDREKAYARCAKSKLEPDPGVPPPPEPPVLTEKLSQRKKRRDKHDSSPLLDGSRDKKRKKKSKKRKRANSSDSSTSSSTSDESTSEDESDKAKSIRVAMRNKMRMQAQLILNEEIGGKLEKLEALGRLVEEERSRKKEAGGEETQMAPPDSLVEDNIINQWMTVTTTNTDKHILDSLKGRLKQRQEADKEKAIEAAAEQRRREREREEREVREMREREQREAEERAREEQEREERDREERERVKERERSRRKRRSASRGRSRSRSRTPGRRRRPRTPEKFEKFEKFPKQFEKFEKFPKRTEFEEDPPEAFKPNKSKRPPSGGSRKLPFIGRMPLFKKKSEGEEKEIKKEEYEIRLSKFEPGNTARAFIPEPGVVHITKLATPLEPRLTAENPPPPPKIIPEPPQISETAPPPPRINDVVTVPEEGMEVQDMELDDAAPPLPPGVPVAEAKPLAKPAGNHLPRDFQEALNIIFPGDQRAEHLAAVQADPNLMMQYQYQMGYGMMYPGMQMYDYSSNQDGKSLSTDENLEKSSDALPPPPLDDKEDLAMLGIDAEDMAAQTF